MSELITEPIVAHAEKLRMPHLAETGEQLCQRAEDAQMSCREFLDLLLEEGEGLYNVTWVGELVSTSDLLMTMREPDCGLISDTITLAPYGELGAVKWAPSSYGWTARVLGRYVREEGVFTLEEAVHRITALPAARLGLPDRGQLREGAFADVTMFDAGEITDLSDLKAPNVYPSGIRHVLVNGRFAMRDGERTQVNAGRVVRRH